MNQTTTTCAERLLSGVDAAALDRALAQSTELSWPKGAVIYSPQAYQHSLGILSAGSVRVSKEDLVVSTLRTGDLFGAAALFNDCDVYAVTLTALSDCTVRFFPQSAILTLMAESGQFAENYVCYLSGRIRFLSSRLDAVSAGTPARKVSQYLLSAMKEDGTVAISATALCKQLGISRASLYRAFDSLEADGVIVRTQKEIRVLDADKLPH